MNGSWYIGKSILFWLGIGLENDYFLYLVVFRREPYRLLCRRRQTNSPCSRSFASHPLLIIFIISSLFSMTASLDMTSWLQKSAFVAEARRVRCKFCDNFDRDSKREIRLSIYRPGASQYDIYVGMEYLCEISWGDSDLAAQLKLEHCYSSVFLLTPERFSEYFHQFLNSGSMQRPSINTLWCFRI